MSDRRISSFISIRNRMLISLSEIDIDKIPIKVYGWNWKIEISHYGKNAYGKYTVYKVVIISFQLK